PRPIEMSNLAPPEPPREFSATLRLRRQQHLQKSPPKKFSVSSQIKYVVAINSQLSTGFGLAFRFADTLGVGSASKRRRAFRKSWPARSRRRHLLTTSNAHHRFNRRAVACAKASRCRGKASILCQFNSGSDDGGDGGGSTFDLHCTRNIDCRCNSTNMAENKSSTAAGSTRRDNNCSVSDKRNSRPETQN